jgi:2-(1,2-epoxy-1,2-dihydrophenyl)acetyl-CoA isomerase
LNTNPDVGAIVLTGKGKHFSSGGDIQRFKMLIETKQYLGVENIALADEMASALRNCAKPVIAMVNGVATGAGLSCALACDFRVVSPSSKLIMGFINMGLPGDTGSIYMLLRLLGPERASKMMMTGDIVAGEEAVACGLASILAAEGELEETTYAFAKKLAAKSNVAMAAQKRLINKYFYGEELEAFYKDEQREMVDASHLPDFTEAVYAFLDKRKPVFNKKL